ncbi:MAG: Ig-like domain-containing protein, partial [Oscillospiraceae bacterium]|nr:Ig-like domain-containing protein [Oscillospiraceae bacterium]
NSRRHKKPNKNPFENIVKEIKKIIAKALAGSTQHIAILVCGALLCVAVVGGAIYGISQIGSSGNPGVEFNEIEIDPEADNNYNKDEIAIDKDKLSSTILPETEDAGQEYIDNTLFIGDSNTVRSLMYEVTGTTWNNVVGAVSMGIQHVVTAPEKVVNFAGMDAVDIITAVRMIQPQRIIITYGTNNAVWDTETFITEYKKAVNAIYDAYPYCDIIVNAIPPVDKLRDYPNITMQQIDKFNVALAEMCDEEGWKFLDSSEALKDDTTGFAKKDYTIGDGIHLSKNGFTALFDYIRTHAYETEDRRPKLTYCPKRNEQEMPIIGEDPIAIRGRLTVKFVSDNYELGTIDGEVEQTVKYTKTSDMVTATPKTENGGIFVGWECAYGGISDNKSTSITYTAPQLSEEITEVVVTAKFKKAEISISKTSANMGIDESTVLSAHITDSFTGDKTISWTSSNPDVAVVEGGKVTAKSAGSTKITASALDGKLQASCTITVSTPIKEIKIAVPEDIDKIKPGGAAVQFKVVAVPDGATVPTVEWSSSDETVATVDKVTGLVKPLKVGKVTITAKVKGREMSDKYELVIKDICDYCKLDKTADCEKAYCTTCKGHVGHEAKSADCPKYCSICKTEGHDDKDTHCTECKLYNRHTATCTQRVCATCGGKGHDAKTDACPKYCSTCKAEGHDENDVHCDVCNQYGSHAATCTNYCSTCNTAGHDENTAACPNYCTICNTSAHKLSDHCQECNLYGSHSAACSKRKCASCGGEGHDAGTGVCPNYCSTCNA